MKKLIVMLFLTLVSSCAYSQGTSADTVGYYYPTAYQNIEYRAKMRVDFSVSDYRYGFDFIEKESFAFLQLRESPEGIDDNALILAIAKYSDEGYSESNMASYLDETIKDRNYSAPI